MKVGFLLLLLPLSFGSMSSEAQECLYTHAHSPLIKSIQVGVRGERMSHPCILLNDNKRIEIEFDHLGDNAPELSYSLIHCDADWTKSDLVTSDYLRGFKNNPIYDFANSNETKVSYNNYKFSLPNEDVRFKVSGNYAVLIYCDEKPSEILATICFTVVDPLVDIKGQVTPVMIDTDWSHQRVNFDVDLKDLAVINPETELKVNVLQNNRRDNLISNPHPSVVTRSVVSYNNSSNIVFAGGNEYRRMAFYKGKNGNFHVEEMTPKKNGYEVILWDDRAKNNFAYQYQADLNGRYFIKCGQCDDSETEAQYCLVKFSLVGDEYTDGKVYVLGDIFNNQLSDASEMIYNPATNQYELNSILKEGRYDYKYVYVPNDSALGTYISIDGDYSQTENEYTVCIYYRPTGGKYDKLIGITTIKNNPIGK